MSSSSSDGIAAAIVAVIGLCLLLCLSLYGLLQLSKGWKQNVQRRLVRALKNRRNEKDTFRATYGYSWDYFMAFRVYDEDAPVSLFQSKYSLKCPLSRLQKHADLVDYKLALDSAALEDLCKKGREGLWDPLSIPTKSELTKLNPYDFIYAKYEYDTEHDRTHGDMLSIYKRHPRVSLEEALSSLNEGTVENPMSEAEDVLHGDEEAAEGPYAGISLKEEASIFRGADRLKLIYMIMSYHGEGGCKLDLQQLLKDECLLAYGPLHDMVDLQNLEKDWLTLIDWPWNQPIERIKDYFGEKVGMYFMWLGVYTTWLVPAAILGLCIWIDIAATDNSPSAPSVPYFAGLIALWSALFLESFKRIEKRTAMKWGMSGFEEEEQDRPQFEGERILSAVTGKPKLFFSRLEAMKRSLFSQVVISTLALIVVAAVAAIFAIQVAVHNAGFTISGVDMSSIVASILLAIQIQFLNGYFGELALQLNNKENHRTDTEFEDSLIAKTFCFQFVNSFASLFYISFVKPFILTLDACGPDGCMGDLQTTLSTIFITRLLLGNFLEVGVPMIFSYLAQKQRKRAAAHHHEHEQLRLSRSQAPGLSSEGMELSNVSSPNGSLSALKNESLSFHEMSEIEKTFVMPEYHVMLGPFEDFAEMVVQFGYTTMFVAAFPLATVLSLVNNYVEIRVDAWKLCHLCRRPEPRSMEDIGTWYTILELISISSIFVNSGLVAFTSNNCVNYTWPERVWIFILMATGLFCIRAIVAFLIPDIPEDVTIQLDRQDYIVGKVVDNIEDEDDNLVKSNFETPSFLITPTDDDPM
eukprot:scaffold409_cov167-Ochromonas_danica.AAC.4